MNHLQKSINWNKYYDEQDEEKYYFKPPIYYAKVVKVYSGDHITVTTKIPFFYETIDSAPFYYFNLYLDGISCCQMVSINKKVDQPKLAKDALHKWIYGKIIEIEGITSDKQGRLYATVFIDKININNWLITNNYAIPCINGNKRRNTISNSLTEKNNFLPIIPTIDLKLEKSISRCISNNSIITPYKNDNNTIDNNTIDNNTIDNNTIDNTIIYKPNYINKTNSSNSLIQSDCFLTHNWGEKNINHEKVKLVNNALKNRGLNTWFDENQLTGNIRFKMAEGIDNTKCAIVFITREYRDKVNGIDMKDNCKYEFSYAVNQLGPQNMIPVIMDQEMKDQKKWKGELGAALGSMMYLDLTCEKELELEKKYDELCKRVKHIIYKQERRNSFKNFPIPTVYLK
jgi:endonuclease YncB( thermonuclease family)